MTNSNQRRDTATFFDWPASDGQLDMLKHLCKQYNVPYKEPANMRQAHIAAARIKRQFEPITQGQAAYLQSHLPKSEHHLIPDTKFLAGQMVKRIKSHSPGPNGRKQNVVL